MKWVERVESILDTAGKELAFMIYAWLVPADTSEQEYSEELDSLAIAKIATFNSKTFGVRYNITPPDAPSRISASTLAEAERCVMSLTSCYA